MRVLKQVGWIFLVMMLGACGRDMPTSPVISKNTDCSVVVAKIVHGDSTFTVRAWYPDTSAMCRKSN